MEMRNNFAGVTQLLTDDGPIGCEFVREEVLSHMVHNHILSFTLVFYKKK